jgi:hypothetical protein
VSIQAILFRDEGGCSFHPWIPDTLINATNIMITKLVASLKRIHTAPPRAVLPTQTTNCEIFSPPCFRLPPELLEHIFLLVRDNAVSWRVHDKELNEDRYQRALTVRTRFADARFDKPPGRRARLAWMAVSHVCRTFRHVALGCARLWTDIDMELDARCVAAFLARARGLPLAVDARFWEHEPSSDEFRWWHGGQPAFFCALAQIAALCLRATEFAAHGLGDGDLRDVLAAYAAPAPSLRRLMLRAAPTRRAADAAAPALPPLFLARAHPALTHVVLRGLRLGLAPALAFAHLRELVLECVALHTGPHEGNEANESVFVSRSRPRVSHLCVWLGDMPRLESLALHGVFNLAKDPAGYVATNVVSLPRLAELRITAHIDVLLALLSGFPAPRRLLACIFRSDTGLVPPDPQRSQLLAERLLEHAQAFYANAPPATEHFSWLDHRDGVGVLQVSKPGKTLVLACADGGYDLVAFCERLFPLHEVPRVGIVLGAKRALPLMMGYLPDYALIPELVVHAAAADITDDIFEPGGDLFPSALNTLRIVGAEAAFFESRCLAWWLQHRATTGAARIGALIFQDCCLRAPVPRWAVLELEELVDDVRWIDEEYHSLLEIDSLLRTNLFLHEP